MSSREPAQPNVGRVLRTASLVAAAIPFAYSVYFAWTAFVFPLEIEIREGTIWMAALAKKAGVDIYDSSQVVFVNMNHGPVDPILKTWAATLFPFLAPSMVTRLFVLALPFCLFGAAFSMGKRRWSPALLASASLYMALAEFTPMLMVGRSDPTVLCELALCLALTDKLMSVPERPRASVLHGLLGASSALVFFTSWRQAPAILLLEALVLFVPLARRSPGRLRFLATRCGLFTLGFVLVFALVFFFEMHGDWQTYYQRFFGFFSKQSGWGARTGGHFRLFPGEVGAKRELGVVLVGALSLFGAYRLRRRPAELVAWALGIPLLWFAISYGLHKNLYGGGVWYYFPFLAILWLFLVRALLDGPLGPGLELAVTIGAVLLLPWRQVEQRRHEVASMQADARAFLREVKERTQGQPILSEDVHLFRQRYRGEIVDMGDAVAAIAHQGGYGPVFTETFQRYVEGLQSRPPRFVMAGLLGQSTSSRTVSPELRELLDTRYTLVLAGPRSFVAWGGGSPALFERNAP